MNYEKQLQHLLLQIPCGKVSTYREIAHAMGHRGYRLVGTLLNKNEHPDTYPCYKVVNADGRVGGFALGQKEKIRRLNCDGIEISNGKIADFKNRLHVF